MATLTLTFGRVASSASSVPLEAGSSSRTEVLTAGASAGALEISELSADGGDSVLSLIADADLWVVIKSDPAADDFSAEPGRPRRFIKADTVYQYSVKSGQYVAAIEA